MQLMYFRRYLAIALGLFVLALGVAPALAQDAPVNAADDTTENEQAPPEVPTATVTEIAREAEAVSTRLLEIRADAEPRDNKLLATFQEQLEDFSDQLDDQEDDLDHLRLDRLSPRALSDLRTRWIRTNSRLENWNAPLLARSEQLAADRTEVQALIKRWQEIRSKPDADYPDPIRDRIDATLELAVTVEKEVDVRLTAILTLEDRVTSLNARIARGLQIVETAQSDARVRLLAPERPPLWRAFGGEKAGSLREQIHQSWGSERAALRKFVQENPHHFAFQLALFLVFLTLTLYLHRRSRIVEQAEDDESLKAAALVLSRPLSAALLLTLVLTRSISPQAPSAVFEIVRLVAIIPLLRILPGLVDKTWRRPLFVMMGLYVVDQARDLTAEASLLQRLLLLLVTALALGGLLWLLSPRGPFRESSRGRWGTVAILLAQLIGLLLFGSLVANFLGTVRLAELLTEAALNSAYLAVGMFALALLLDGMTTVALRTRAAQALNFVRHHQAAVKARISRAIRLIAAVAWVVFTLLFVGLLEPVTEWLAAWCFSKWTFGAVEISIANVLVLAGAVWAALQISRFIRFVLDEDVLVRIDLPVGVPQAVSMLVYYGILVIGFVVALAAAGIELTQLTLLISALGVGIGFGLQNVVNNFVSGMILIFERPIKIGDVVEVGTLTGEVRKIGIRASVVKTFSGSEVIVPNGNLISSEVINWTLSDRRRRIEMPVGVAYGTDPNRVIEILLECVRFRDDVHDKPGPQALFLGFGNSSLDFELRFWSSSDRWMQVRSEVNVDINGKLAEAGIEIPFPQRDLHLRSVDPGAGEALGASRDTPDES